MSDLKLSGREILAGLRITVTVASGRRLKVRVRLGSALLGLAARLMGVKKIEIHTEGDDACQR